MDKINASYSISFLDIHKTAMLNAFRFYISMQTGKWDVLYDICKKADDDRGTASSREEFVEAISVVETIAFPNHDASAMEDDVEVARQLMSRIENADKELVLSTQEARFLCRVTEFFARMRMGQWDNIVYTCIDIRDNAFCEKRDELIPRLMTCRVMVYPYLRTHYGSSYGVGKFLDADTAWEIYEVVRYRMAWTEHPEGGSTVNFGTPMSFSGQPMMRCEVARI